MIHPLAGTRRQMHCVSRRWIEGALSERNSPILASVSICRLMATSPCIRDFAMPVRRRAPQARIGRANRVAADAADFGEAHGEASHAAVFEIFAAAPGAGAPWAVFVGLALSCACGDSPDRQSENHEFSHREFLCLGLLGKPGEDTGGKPWRCFPPGLHFMPGASRLATEIGQPVKARSFAECGARRTER